MLSSLNLHMHICANLSTRRYISTHPLAYIYTWAHTITYIIFKFFHFFIHTHRLEILPFLKLNRQQPRKQKEMDKIYHSSKWQILVHGHHLETNFFKIQNKSLYMSLANGCEAHSSFIACVCVHATYACVFMFAFMWAYLFMQLYLSPCGHACGSQQLLPDVFLHFSPPYLLRQNLIFKPKMLQFG